MPCQKAAAHIMNKISDHAAALRRRSVSCPLRLCRNISAKTPLALGPWPEANRLPAPVVKRFTDLYGESVMARSEALRYHGTQLMAQAAQRLPAVVLRADRYLLCGAMGLDVLSNLVPYGPQSGPLRHCGRTLRRSRRWLGGEVNADAVTISPYHSTAAAGEDKALFALVRTAEPGAAEVQNLMAGGSSPVFGGGEQMMAPPGAGSWPRRITVWTCGSCGGG